MDKIKTKNVEFEIPRYKFQEWDEAKNRKAFYLAGIIPVSGKHGDLGFPWHDSLMPIGEDYTALESAIYSCVLAGCRTIFMVCNDDISPMIRCRIGEMVNDPVYLSKRQGNSTQRNIPIYYVPVHPGDVKIRDSLPWSILYGAKVANWMSGKLSYWCVPDMYFVSFPWGLIPEWELRPHRKLISTNYNMFFKYDGKTALDGLKLPFTINRWQVEKMIQGLHKEYFARGKEKEDATAITLDKMLSYAIINTKLIKEEDLTWFYDISSWKEYAEYMATNLPQRKHPNDELPYYHKTFTYDKWYSMFHDNADGTPSKTNP